MSVFEDIKTMSIVGMFVILFLIGTTILAYFLGALNDITTEMGIPSHTVEFASLEFTFGFAALICIAGSAYILFRQHKKKKQFEEGN